MNNFEFIPYGTQDINNEDIKAVNLVLKSDFLTQGPEIKKFEEAISAKVHAKYSLGRRQILL
jgi:dTDP-4-amino-4,6-dideoxygalactose transaminase